VSRAPLVPITVWRPQQCGSYRRCLYYTRLPHHCALVSQVCNLSSCLRPCAYLRLRALATQHVTRTLCPCERGAPKWLRSPSLHPRCSPCTTRDPGQESCLARTRGGAAASLSLARPLGRTPGLWIRPLCGGASCVDWPCVGDSPDSPDGHQRSIAPAGGDSAGVWTPEPPSPPPRPQVAGLRIALPGGAGLLFRT
jgi:hypothetical protein